MITVAVVIQPDLVLHKFNEIGEAVLANTSKKTRSNSNKNDEEGRLAIEAGTTASLKFEEAYDRLMETAAKLEKGGLSLEESLALYEEGVVLSQRCQELLDEAELKVTQLTPNHSIPSSSPKTYIFAADEDEDYAEDSEGEEENTDDENWNDDDLRKALEDFKF